MDETGHTSAAQRLAKNSITALRKANLGPSELAALSGIAVDQIEAILAGEGGGTTLDVLAKLADGLGVSASSLVS